MSSSSNTGAAVTVGTWNLLDKDHGVEAAESFMLLQPYGALEESTFDPDNRTLVPAGAYKTGGKYRSIVKLQLRYEKQEEDDERWAMGTGWLIRPDLLVTAGHCVYDWRDSLGKVIQVKAYIGYSGKESVGSPDVQFRRGHRIATTEGWLKDPENRTNDVSFIQVEKPFTGVVPFKFAETPLQGNDILGVVGYPADMKLNDKKDGEKGAQMYEEFETVKYNIAASPKHMLEYGISTYAGQSGSPVLRKDKTNVISIGAHVYGGTGNNSASPIAGQYGNPYDSYIAVFDQKFASVKKVAGINYVSVPVNIKRKSGSNPSPEEGFFDVLKDIVKIGGPIASNVLTVGAPFLGPIGGPVSVLAGTALGFASKMAESAREGSESSMSPKDHKAFASRALLGEAALQTVLSMDRDTVESSGLLSTMQNSFNKMVPFVSKVAPKILPVVLEPALRVALNSMQKMQANGGESGFGVTNRRRALPVTAAETGIAERDLDPNTEVFMAGLLAPTLQVQGAEGFFDSLGDIIKTGLSIGVPLLKTAAPGLGFLGGLLPESSIAPSDLDNHLQVLSNRAIMGEAALQGLMRLPKQQLEEEGFFDSMKTIMQQLGTQVLQTAPSVIKAAAPIVLSLLQKQGGESAIDVLSKAPRTKKSQTFADSLEEGGDGVGDRAPAAPRPKKSLGFGDSLGNGHDGAHPPKTAGHPFADGEHKSVRVAGSRKVVTHNGANGANGFLGTPDVRDTFDEVHGADGLAFDD